MDNLIEAIKQLKKEKNAIILGGKGALSRQEGAGARHGGRLFAGGQLSGGQVRSVCQRASRIYGHILREHNGCGEGGDRCGGNFYQCKADCGKLPQR